MGRVVRLLLGLWASLLVAACGGGVALDAPPPTAGLEPAAAPAAAVQSAEEPAWLRDLLPDNPGDKPALGLKSDSRARAYSGEALTFEDSGKARPVSETRKPAKSMDLLDRLLANNLAEDPPSVSPPSASGEVAAVPPPKAAVVETSFLALPNVTGYRLQLATLRSTKAAGQAWLELVERFPDILGDKRLFLVDLDLGYRGIQHRIEAGPYGTLELAWQACLTLMSRLQGCTVSLP